MTFDQAKRAGKVRAPIVVIGATAFKSERSSLDAYEVLNETLTHTAEVRTL